MAEFRIRAAKVKDHNGNEVPALVCERRDTRAGDEWATVRELRFRWHEIDGIVREIVDLSLAHERETR